MAQKPGNLRMSAAPTRLQPPPALEAQVTVAGCRLTGTSASESSTEVTLVFSIA